MWHSSLFPPSLRVLEIHLDPHESSSLAVDLISALELSVALQPLNHLEELVLTSDILLEATGAEPFKLPSLRRVTLQLCEEDFEVVAPLLPKREDLTYDITFCPYPWQDTSIRSTYIMVQELEIAIEHRKGTFTHLSVDATPAEVRFTLFDADGRYVCLKVEDDFAASFARLLRSISPDTVTAFSLQELAGGSVDYRDREKQRAREIVEAVGVLSNVRTVTVKGEIGFICRDLLGSLAGKPGRAVFSFAELQDIEWRQWRTLRLEDIRGGLVIDTPWSVDEFIGLCLVCFNMPISRLKSVKVVRGSLNIDHIRGWHEVVSSVIVSGEFGQSFY